MCLRLESTHGRHQGGAGGANAPPWNLKMMMSYVIPQQITLIFSLALSALTKIAPKFSLKRREIT